VFEKLIEKGSESIDWLVDKAQNEWFNTEEAANEYFSNEDNRKQLLDNPVIKLNHDFLSYLILSPHRYADFYGLMASVLADVLTTHPSLDSHIIDSLLDLCYQRNYVARCLRGITSTSDYVLLSDEVARRLVKILPKEQSFVFLQIDEPIAKSIRLHVSRESHY
jgi:hypothetical protein